MNKSENGTMISSQWDSIGATMRSTFSLNSTDTLRKVKKQTNNDIIEIISVFNLEYGKS